MEIEAQTLLNEENKKNDSFLTFHRSKGRRLRSWATVIATHTLVAVLVFLTLDPLRWRTYIQSYTHLGDKMQSRLYCMLQIATFRLPLTKGVAPLTPVIEYTVDTPPEDYWGNDLYFGTPRQESERAWNKMIHRKQQWLGRKEFPQIKGAQRLGQ